MIRGEHTNLRAVERTDASTLHRWLNGLDGARGWQLGPLPVSLSVVQSRIEGWLEDERINGRPSALVIDDLVGRPVGAVLLTHFEPDNRAIEITLLTEGPETWNERYDVDALCAVIELAFDQWNIHRLTARAPLADERAVAAYESSGFRRDVISREAAFFDGVYHDVALFCRLRTDSDESNPDYG